MKRLLRELDCWLVKGHSWNGCLFWQHPALTCFWCGKRKPQQSEGIR